MASIISEYENDWREYDAKIVDCALSEVLGSSVLDKIKAKTCRVTAATASINANLAAKNIRKLDTPPKEMGALVARTLAALDSLAATGAGKSCVTDNESVECGNDATKVNGAIRPVVSVLDAWKPYTG
ncbi:hypothetical protein [Arthrobacter cryoconiti]|uniref:Uncharacterized protein n=1 Tax=Arthrobacter cryoconiti TaxID=748907 RepID=A0ABV8QWH3_9MICC|nr:hypothetical protein [Arthrobacter cryoconiti]MCC9068853.1 hypothetical protein [Arthrobacter cryoconiti]